MPRLEGARMATERMKTVTAEYFDTVNAISACCNEALLEEAVAQCADYDALLSRFVPGSDVWEINHALGKRVHVSQHTATVLSLARQVAEASGGAFNIALGTLAALWAFTSGRTRVPSSEGISTALANTDCTLIEIGPGWVKAPSGMQIDLGGIAKGYIADRVADFLRERGVSCGLLNFGGNVVTIGKNIDGAPWSVGLQTPGGAAGRDFWAAVECSDATVVTSGVYERGFDVQGVRYHHILDPRTGYPVQNGLLSVTAVGPDSLVADALTTAMFVLGIEKGSELASRFGVEFAFLDRDGCVWRSPGLALTICSGRR